MVIEQNDRMYVRVRYNNFAAINAPVEPSMPAVAVPLYRDIAAVVAEGLALEKALMDYIVSTGMMKVVRMCHPDVSGPASEREIAYLARLDCPFRIFRGEKTVARSIMPSRYRFTGQPDPLATTRQRIEFETQCADRMKEYLARHGARAATSEQARAAARHYGAPSSFVDFTFNPRVAAFFAHPSFSKQERELGADIGIVYSLGIGEFEKLFGLAAIAPQPDGGRDIHYINVATEWRLPYKSFDPENGVEDAVLTIAVPPRLVAKPMSIRTRFVPAVPRIEAQDGIFIDLHFEDPEDWWSQVLLWTVLDFASQKWCFLRSDFDYEAPETGVTAATVYPPDDPELTELAKDFGNWS